jgi:AbrB family looped-hinge helix DNA binding protein
MRLTSKGQVTIPQQIREQLGLLAGTEVEFELDGDSVRIRKSTSPARMRRGRAIVEHTRGRGNRRFTTDQLMRLMRG